MTESIRAEECLHINGDYSSRNSRIKRIQQITHLASGQPKPQTHRSEISTQRPPCFCAARRRKSQIDARGPRVPATGALMLRSFFGIAAATLVGGSLLIGQGARVKLVPRVLRMCQVPGSHYTCCRKAHLIFVPHTPTLCVSAARLHSASWHCASAFIGERRAIKRSRCECAEMRG